MSLTPSHTVVLRSTNYYAGTNKNSLQYAIDWSFLPDGKYALGYNFISKSVTDNQIVFISLPDLGVVMNSFTAGSQTSANTNTFLGVVSNWYAGTTSGGAGYLYSNYLTNPPIRLESKPTNNIFTVNLYDNTGTTLYTMNAEYVLVLYFERIE